MPILFKLHKLVRTFKDGRTDPANNKWFARAINVETATTDELAEALSYATTVTPADCKAVLKGLGKAMGDLMKKSQAVRLENIGTFKVGLKSTGADSVGEFSVNTNITGMRVLFQPEYTIDPSSRRKVVPMLLGAKITETPKNDIVKG